MISSWLRVETRVAVVVLCGLSVGGPAVAQQPVNRGPIAGEVAVEPINCWWRTDKSAVEVGERFTLTLTCRIVETDRNRVVVDPSQLDPGALSLSPFEIAGGARHQDVVSSPWRHFQYEYSVRVVGTAFFGQDVDIPSINLKYSVVSSIGDTEGREQQYILPAIPMRIMSLLPAKADDILELSAGSFGDLERRRRRANEEFIGGAIAFGFAGVLLVLAVARVFSLFRKRTVVTARPVSAGLILRATASALHAVKSDVAREGWSVEHAARALAALRIAAAVAVGRTVAELAATQDTPVREGQISLKKGWLRGPRALISAATGSVELDTQLASRAGRHAGAVAVAGGELRDALLVFTATRYSRSDRLDAASLESALEKGEQAVRRLRVRALWPFGTKRRLSPVAAISG